VSESYVAEKLYSAVYSLDSDGVLLEKRLMGAVLSLHLLQPSDFANLDDVARFTAIMERFDSHEAVGDEGTFEASLHRMSDEQHRALEREIRDLAARHPF
jgi:hypothetical protein